MAVRVTETGDAAPHTLHRRYCSSNATSVYGCQLGIAGVLRMQSSFTASTFDNAETPAHLTALVGI